MTLEPGLDLAPRAEALESLLVERGLVDTKTIETLHQHLRDAGRPDERGQGRRQGVDGPGLPGPAARRRHRRHRRAGLQGPAGRAHRGRREHPDGPPRRGVHAVLLLPVAGARAAARPGTRTRPTASRVVREPRAVLAEWGSISARMSRSRCTTPARRSATSCCPSGPAGTEDLSEEELAALVDARRDGGRRGRWRPVSDGATAGCPSSTSTGRPRRRAATASWSSRRPGRAGRSAWRHRPADPGVLDYDSFRDALIARDRGLGGRRRAGECWSLLPLLAAGAGASPRRAGAGADR